MIALFILAALVVAASVLIWIPAAALAWTGARIVRFIIEED